MNQLPTLEELDVTYVQYVLLTSDDLTQAVQKLGTSDSTLRRIRQRHNLIGPLAKPLKMTFEEFIKLLDKGFLGDWFKNLKRKPPEPGGDSGSAGPIGP